MGGISGSDSCSCGVPTDAIAPAYGKNSNALLSLRGTEVGAGTGLAAGS